MPKIELIDAQQSDLSICMEMMKDFYLIDNYPFNEKKAESNFNLFISETTLGRFWIIKNENKICGYLVLTFGFSFEYGGRDAFMDEFYLKPTFRDGGIGKRVLKILNEKAKSLGVYAIHLEVEKSNERTNALYSQSGYIGNNRSLLTNKLAK